MQMLIMTGAGGGNAPVSLPLPLAALIGLTIMFKPDKKSEMVLSVAGPGLGSCSGGGPWFSMQVVAALWAQKIRRWHDYIVYAAACSVFRQNKQAVLQLLRSCFAVTLSSSSAAGSKLQMNGGVGALLGHGMWSASGNASEPLSPGIMYLRSYPMLHDIMFLSNEVLLLVAEAARDLGAQSSLDWETSGTAAAHGSRLRCVQPSLSTSMARAVQASSLGASLLYISGGTTLVSKLFTESLPTWFLSASGSKSGQASGGMILEGYAVAHFALLSGALAWGVSGSKGFQLSSPGSTGVPLKMRRHYVLGSHMEFLASGLGGDVAVGCEQTIWRSYVVGFVALMVTCTPTWILELDIETLRKVATGLRFWHEHDLAIALLERGGPSAMGAAAELTLG